MKIRLQQIVIAVLFVVSIVVARIRQRGREAQTDTPAIDTTPCPLSDPAAASAEWLMFGHDAGHAGRAPLDFPSADLVKAWSFKAGRHVWQYRKGSSVWSSPVIANVQNRATLFVGSYDRSIYALDAKTGEKVWRISAGDGIFATPALGRICDQPLLFFASTDRKVYAVDARDGSRVWVHECLEWSDTVAPSIMSSPAFALVGGQPMLFVGAHVNDQSGPRSVQEGSLLALDATNGAVRWRYKDRSSPMTSPVLGEVEGRAMVFVINSKGVLYGLDARTGRRHWFFPMNEMAFSSPTFARTSGRTLLFFGSRFHTLYAVDAKTGRQHWQRRASYFIDSTPAVAEIDGRLTVFFGSYDRKLYAVDAASGKTKWTFPTRGDICASPAVLNVAGQPAVVIHSHDDHLYLVEARSGALLWQAEVGRCLWTHFERTDSIWSSPAAAVVDGVPMLFFASYSGEIHAFVAK